MTPAHHVVHRRERVPRNQSEGANDGRVLNLAFRLYKSILSPLLHIVSPGRCLYLPTCSEYAYTAIHRFGAARGSWMALCRIARCHPWGKGGLDPVPEHLSSAGSADQPTPNQSNQTTADHLP